jgi:hypothetical protein
LFRRHGVFGGRGDASIGGDANGALVATGRGGGWSVQLGVGLSSLEGQEAVTIQPSPHRESVNEFPPLSPFGAPRHEMNSPPNIAAGRACV